MTLAAWLLALVAPLVVRAVIALGFTAVVFTGVTAGVNQLVETAQTNWSALPTTVLQLATLSGIPESLGMIFGAYMSLFALQASMGFGKYVFKK
jgi:hypothetical protein